MTQTAFLESSIPGIPVRRGKVRDIYDFGDRLLFIATDRISAFDWVLPNVFMIADSNHGFKLTGVGKLVANMLASGEKAAELQPFALDRFRTGRTFGDRNSNCPWV